MNKLSNVFGFRPIRLSVFLSLALTGILVCGGLASQANAQGGKLGRMRAAVRKPKPEPPRKTAPKPKAPRPNPPAKKADPKPARNSSNDSGSNGRRNVDESSSSGKLNNVRNQVRNEKQIVVSKKKPGRANDGSSNRRDGRGQVHRHNDRFAHRGGSRSSGVIYFAPPVTHAVQPPIVVPVVETMPAFVPPPVMAEPVYGAEVYQSQIQPPVAIESLRPAEMVVEEGPVIENWFQDRTSSLWATLGSDFDGITAGGAGFKFQAPRGLGLEGSVMTLRESGTNFRDNLWLGDLNLVGEIVNRPNVRGRIGIGFNWLADSWGSEAGLNLTAGADLKLTERLMVSLESDIGTLGDADFFHARINASRRFDSLEWITGVDHFNIGGAEINSVFTGIQLRF